MILFSVSGLGHYKFGSDFDLVSNLLQYYDCWTHYEAFCVSVMMIE